MQCAARRARAGPESPSSQAESTRSRTDALTERRIREQRKSANSDGPFGFLPDSKQKFHDGAFSRLPADGSTFCTAQDRFGLVPQLRAVLTQGAILSEQLVGCILD